MPDVTTEANPKLNSNKIVNSDKSRTVFPNPAVRLVSAPAPAARGSKQPTAPAGKETKLSNRAETIQRRHGNHNRTLMMLAGNPKESATTIIRGTPGTATIVDATFRELPDRTAYCHPDR